VRAGRPGQAGEILWSTSRTRAVFGADGLRSWRQLRRGDEVVQAQRPLLEKKLGEQGMLLLYAVAWPPQGNLLEEADRVGGRLKGSKWRPTAPPPPRIAELVGAQR